MYQPGVRWRVWENIVVDFPLLYSMRHAMGALNTFEREYFPCGRLLPRQVIDERSIDGRDGTVAPTASSQMD